MLGNVTLRRDGARLLADVKGNLPGLLDVDLELFVKLVPGGRFSHRRVRDGSRGLSPDGESSRDG